MLMDKKSAQKWNTIIVGDYYHIKSTVTYDYYGMDGTYLGQQSTTGLYNKPYSVNVPYRFGNYYIEGSTTRSGLYPKTDETLNVYYKYIPPIVYYNTSNPYATTYYANGYEYVPNYIAPVVYYAPTMAITVEVLLTLVIMVIHQEEYIVILTELTIQIMYHNLLIILKRLNLWRRKEDMAETSRRRR